MVAAVLSVPSCPCGRARRPCPAGWGPCTQHWLRVCVHTGARAHAEQWKLMTEDDRVERRAERAAGSLGELL